MQSSYLRADAPELHDVGVVELPEVEDVGLHALLDLLDGDQLALPAADEDDALRARPEPLLVQDRLEGDFPFVCKDIINYIIFCLVVYTCKDLGIRGVIQ